MPETIFVLTPGRGARAGGIGRVAINLVESIPEVDPELKARLLDTRGSGSLAFAPVFLAKALVSIVASAARKQIAVLHVNLASRGSTVRKAITVALASILRVPVVIQLHGGGFRQFYKSLPSPLQGLVRRMFSLADRIIVPGEYWRRFVIDDLRVAAKNIEIIPNGSSRPKTSRVLRKDSPLHILFVGRLVPAKGTLDLIDALALPAIVALQWVVTFAGDGDHHSLAAYAKEKGLGDRAVFPGWVDGPEVDALLSSASLFVLPSHAENLPMSVIEALAHGVPTIVTAVGAIPDYLMNGETALIVEPRNPSALANAIELMLNDPALREGVGQRGQKLFLERFDNEVIVERMVNVYRDILAEHRDHRRTRPGFVER